MNNENLLFGKFEIIETLKKDGQSSVYLANHIYLNKKIILKTLNTRNLKEPTILHRFKREAKILAKLDHPNIIKVLDFGTHEDFFYLSFEYFESQSLREYIKTKKPNSDEFFKIVSQILLGLDYAHKQKIIHRDLKPENILIDKNLFVKIADFGLALSEDENQVTQQESIVGTPGYMSPEQIRGETLDTRTDIFSFGIIAYELVTGKNPFIGKDVAATINNILVLDKNELTQSLTHIPENLSNVILKCLEKQRANRFQNVSEIISALNIEKPLETYSEERTKKILFTNKAKIVFALILAILILSVSYFHIKNSFKSQSEFPKTESEAANLKNQEMPSQKEIISETEKSIPEKKVENIQKNLETNQTTTQNLKGSLIITCYPWADIYINNQKYETTPLDNPITLEPGNYTIKLVHPNFPPVEKKVEINSNEVITLDVNFYKTYSFINFQIIPWGEVKINGKRIGISPFERPLIVSPGKQFIEIYNPNFGNFIDTILVQKGETLIYKLNFNAITNWHNN
ncbi:MAG: protein kinase [Ignavibacteria bacterium]|nr:protein kinase [Ignavibacteria bacterium]